jgi:hypothetical protein
VKSLGVLNSKCAGSSAHKGCCQRTPTPARVLPTSFHRSFLIIIVDCASGALSPCVCPRPFVQAASIVQAHCRRHSDATTVGLLLLDLSARDHRSSALLPPKLHCTLHNLTHSHEPGAVVALFSLLAPDCTCFRTVETPQLGSLSTRLIRPRAYPEQSDTHSRHHPTSTPGAAHHHRRCHIFLNSTSLSLPLQ